MSESVQVQFLCVACLQGYYNCSFDLQSAGRSNGHPGGTARWSQMDKSRLAPADLILCKVISSDSSACFVWAGPERVMDKQGLTLEPRARIAEEELHSGMGGLAMSRSLGDLRHVPQLMHVFCWGVSLEISARLHPYAACLQKCDMEIPATVSLEPNQIIPVSFETTRISLANYWTTHRIGASSRWSSSFKPMRNNK